MFKKTFNKKATFNILNYSILRLPFILLLFLITYLFAYSNVKISIDLEDTKATLFLERLLYSQNSIIYTDTATGRAYPGVVDLERFNEIVLKKAFNSSKSDVAAKIELVDLENNEKKEIYINREWYERWRPLTKFEQYEKFIKQRYVLINDKGKIKKGLLRIDMVISNV